MLEMKQMKKMIPLSLNQHKMNKLGDGQVNSYHNLKHRVYQRKRKIKIKSMRNLSNWERMKLSS